MPEGPHAKASGCRHWSADKSRAGYRYGVYHGGGYSFRVVRTLNVQP